MKNALSVDLEEWFCGHVMEPYVKREEWPKEEPRAFENTRKCLRILARHETRGTFFVLGWIAQRHPELIGEIEDAGHEIATHGYSHTLLTDMTPEEFKADLAKALQVTGSAAKQEIKGFRAPSFTVTKSTLWAYPIMKEMGIRYDSSVFPIGFHPDYGMPEAPLEIHERKGIIEMPMTCVEIMGKRIPCAGGAYFRYYPYPLTRTLLRRCNREGRPIIFYLHPWELDPSQPRIQLPYLQKIRHYYGLSRVEHRLDLLLSDFSFTTMAEVAGL